MEEKQLIRQTVQTVMNSRQAPRIEETPYQYVARMMFACGFAIGLIVASGKPYQSMILVGIITGTISSGFTTAVYVFFVTHKSFQQETQTKTEEYVRAPREDIEPFRITSAGYTTNIKQPKAGAFAKWAQDVLTNSRVYFSERQALERGFDYQNVIGELKRVGIVMAKSDKNGVYQLTDHGRELLKNAG